MQVDKKRHQKHLKMINFLAPKVSVVEFDSVYCELNNLCDTELNPEDMLRIIILGLR